MRLISAGSQVRILSRPPSERAKSLEQGREERNRVLWVLWVLYGLSSPAKGAREALRDTKAKNDRFEFDGWEEFRRSDRPRARI
jgi:hypothetical protein